MKRLLLGTTALIGAGLISQSAQAADQPVKLSISGFFQAGYGVIAHESGGGSIAGSESLADGIQDYGLIDFSGDTTFANGYGAGVFVEFYAFGYGDPAGTTGGYGGDGGSGTTATQQAWLHITNAKLGEFRIGDQNDALRAKEVIAPEFATDDMFSANSPDILLNNAGTNTTENWIGARYSASLGWYSPVYSGFQLAVTYAPDASRGGTYDSPSHQYNATVAGIDNFRDKYAAAVNWSGTVWGMTMSATGGISGATTKKNVDLLLGTTTANPLIYNLGYSITVGPWAVGADYEQVNNPFGVSSSNNKVTDLGLTYTIGAWTAGAEVSRGSYKNGLDGYHAAVPGFTPKLTNALAGATYNLGPGVNLTGAVAFDDFDNGKAPTLKGYDAVELLVGTDIHF